MRRSVWLGWGTLALGALAAAAVGCASVLGIGDVSLFDGGAASDSEVAGGDDGRASPADGGADGAGETSDADATTSDAPPAPASEGGAPEGGSNLGRDGGDAAVTYVFEAIDDMKDPLALGILTKNGREGTWFFYTDGTDGGLTAPPPGSLFVPTPAPGAPAGISYAREVRGSGFTGYGAGMGFPLNANAAYDARAYAGIRFWARGSPGTFTVTVQDRASDPHGGVCDPDAGPAAPNACYQGFASSPPLTDAWAEHTILFSELQGPSQRTLDRSALYALNFTAPVGAPLDLAIADVGFVANAPVDAGPQPASLLIDDMSGWRWIRVRVPPGDEPGTWYTFNDGTGIQAPLPTLVADAVSVPTDSGPPITRAACTESLSPFAARAAFGFDFAEPADALSDGGVGGRLPWDVSAHSGISFWVLDRSGGGGVLEVHLTDSNSDPLAGRCLSADGGTAQCFDDFQTTVPLSSAWVRQSVPFAGLHQLGFGFPSPTGALDARNVYSLHFQIENVSDAGLSFDFCVADIEFQ